MTAWRAAAIHAAVSHAREAAPQECCGVLVGRPGEIVEAVRVRNIADEPTTRFLIDPAGHFEVMRRARERSLAVVGFYHSHPRAAAEPSARDQAEFTYPGHLYAIVGLRTEPAEVALFLFGSQGFQPLSFVVLT